MRTRAIILTVLLLFVPASGCRYAGAITDASGTRGVRWEHEVQTDVHLAYDPPTQEPAEPAEVVE